MPEILQKIEFYLTFFALMLTGLFSSCLGPPTDPYEKVDFTGLSVEQIEEKHGEFDIKYCTRSDSEPSPAPVKITEASYICDEDHRDSFGDYLGIYLHTVYFDKNGLAESSKGYIERDESSVRYKIINIDENHSPGYYTKEEVKKIYSENVAIFERARNIHHHGHSGLFDLTSLDDSDICFFSEADRNVLAELFALKPYKMYFKNRELSHILFLSAEGIDCSVLVFCGDEQDSSDDQMRTKISMNTYLSVDTQYAECIGNYTILCHNEPYGRVPGEHFDPDTFLNCTPEYLSNQYRQPDDPYGEKLGVWKPDGTKRPSVQVYQKAFFHGETDDTSVDSKYEDVYVIYFDENGISYDYKVEERQKLS